MVQPIDDYFGMRYIWAVLESMKLIIWARLVFLFWDDAPESIHSSTVLKSSFFECVASVLILCIQAAILAPNAGSLQTMFVSEYFLLSVVLASFPNSIFTTLQASAMDASNDHQSSSIGQTILFELLLELLLFTGLVVSSLLEFWAVIYMDWSQAMLHRPCTISCAIFVFAFAEIQKCRSWCFHDQVLASPAKCGRTEVIGSASFSLWSSIKLLALWVALEPTCCSWLHLQIIGPIELAIYLFHEYVVETCTSQPQNQWMIYSETLHLYPETLCVQGESFMVADTKNISAKP